HGCAGLDTETAEKLLLHPDADVRGWCVRLLGDKQPVSSRAAARLVELAGAEADASVRSQLACTARRLDPRHGLDVAYRILLRDLDGADTHIPLLLWWAVESHALLAREHALELFGSAESWRSALIGSTVRPRMVRRYALEGSAACDLACVRLLRSAPNAG